MLLQIYQQHYNTITCRKKNKKKKNKKKTEILKTKMPVLTLLRSERPKLYTILAFLSAIGLTNCFESPNIHPFLGRKHVLGTYANSADQVQMPCSAESDMGLHCLLIGYYKSLNIHQKPLKLVVDSSK